MHARTRKYRFRRLIVQRAPGRRYVAVVVDINDHHLRATAVQLNDVTKAETRLSWPLKIFRSLNQHARFGIKRAAMKH